VRLTAVDLFAGAGGVTTGYKQAGLRVVAAVELDSKAAETYRLNHPEVEIFEKDIRRVAPNDLRQALRGRSLDVLTACSPCKSYSTLARGDGKDDDKDLVLVTLRYVRALRPRVVVMENVPRLSSDQRFSALTTSLTALGYQVWHQVLDAYEFGVPQRRRRLVLIAARGAQPRRPRKSAVRRSVSHAIRRIDPRDKLHRARALKGIAAKRVAAVTINGGSRQSFTGELVLACHKSLSGAATSVYGRMNWSRPAPTLTTRCTTPSCGRFLHPFANRPITLREAACLQSFPRRYKFAGARGDVERQVGNAVPVEMARRIAVEASRLARLVRRLEKNA
jgi:DNA (cytosine-5)-methyltransferase 1